MVKVLSQELVEETLAKARQHSRKRAMYCFSQEEELLQRMINAGIKGTYIQPHKHDNPDKFEIISIIKGELAVFTYHNDGSIATCTLLSSGNKAVEIPAKTWHNMVVLSNEAACHEIILGVYEASTHKQFAPWAPSESEPEKAQVFLAKLEKYAMNSK
jgi:cupin fold WbuC family metalloprotein